VKRIGVGAMLGLMIGAASEKWFLLVLATAMAVAYLISIALEMMPAREVEEEVDD